MIVFTSDFGWCFEHVSISLFMVSMSFLFSCSVWEQDKIIKRAAASSTWRSDSTSKRSVQIELTKTFGTRSKSNFVKFQKLKLCFNIRIDPKTLCLTFRFHKLICGLSSLCTDASCDSGDYEIFWVLWNETWISLPCSSVQSFQKLRPQFSSFVRTTMRYSRFLERTKRDSNSTIVFLSRFLTALFAW